MHVEFEGRDYPMSACTTMQAHGVYIARFYWVGELQAPQTLQRSNPYDKLARSTVSNACLVWGERLPTCVALLT